MAGSKVLIEYYHAVDDGEEVRNESQKEQGTSQQVRLRNSEPSKFMVEESLALW